MRLAFATTIPYDKAMPEPRPLADRLGQALFKLDEIPKGDPDAEAMVPLRRSIERTLARLDPAGAVEPAVFRFQLTGGKPILLQGKDALPLEPARLLRLVNVLDLQLQPGEALELDGDLAAWLIRPEVNLTDSELRRTDTKIRTMKTGRDRDHGEAQAADSTKVRLRSRLTQLIGALQAAQKDTTPDKPTS